MSSSVITASYDRQVRFWDPVSGRTIRNFVFQDSQINALSVSKDRCRLAVAGHGVIRYYDIASSSQYPPAVATFECSAAANFTAIGHMPLDNGTGSLLYACSEDGVLRILDPRQSTMSVLKECSANPVAITCATLSADGRLLITGSQIGKVSVWLCRSFIEEAGNSSTAGSAVSTKPLQELSFTGDHTAIRSIAFSPLSNWVAVSTNAGKVHCLGFSKDVRPAADQSANSASGAATPQRSAFLAANQQHQRSMSDTGAVNSDSTSVVSGGGTHASSDTPVRLNDPTPLNNAGTDDPSPMLSTPALATSAPKPPVLLLSKDQKEWFLECVHSMTCHYKYILKVAISPDGKMLATCCADYTVGLWQVPKILARPGDVEEVLKSMAPSPSKAATEGAGQDAGSPTALGVTAVPQALTPKTSMGSMSPQRDASVAAYSPQATKQPNPYEFVALKPLQGHTRWVWDCAFSPCSTVLVTVSSDNHVRLWSNIHTDKPKSDIFVGHTKPVVCVLLDVDRSRVDT